MSEFDLYRCSNRSLIASAWLVLAFLLTTAEVSAQSSVNGQFRGFWVTAFSAGLKSAAEIAQVLADLDAANANAVIAQVGRRGDAYYNRGFQPRTDDAALAAGFDALQSLIDQSRSRPDRVEVHAWLSTLALWNTTMGTPASPRHVYNEHGPAKPDGENWFTRRFDGVYPAGSDYYVDPGHPDALDYVVKMYAYTAANYDIDGIHLDRVRYPEISTGSSLSPEWGYNPTAVGRFMRLSARATVPLPDDPTWVEWRRRQLRNLVRKIYLSAVALNPEVKVTAATVAFGAGPRSMEEYRQSTRTYRQVLQDPIAYLREGILDMDIPMNYDREHLDDQSSWFRNWIEFEKNNTFNRHLAIGTALYLNTIANSIIQYRAALAASAQGNMAQGVSGFSQQSTNSENLPGGEFMRALSQPSRYDPHPVPVFSEKVATPEMPWKTRPSRGHIIGMVTFDPTHPADELTVLLRGENDTRELLTDGKGWFGFVDVFPGSYQAYIDGIPAGELLEVKAGRVTAVTLQRGLPSFTLVFPFIEEGDSQYSGLALTHPANGPARIKATLFDDAGMPQSQASFMLASGAQSSQLARQLFPQLSLEQLKGWVEIESDQPLTYGLFQQGDTAGTRLDGSLTGLRGAQHLIFPQLAQGPGFFGGEARTDLFIVNPAGVETTVLLKLFGPEGTERARRVDEVPAKGRLRGSISSLFPMVSLPIAGGYIEARAATEVVGFEWVRYPNSATGLAAQSPDASQRMYAAHFPSGRLSGTQYYSELNIINTGKKAVEVTARLVADDGQPLQVAGVTNPARITLAPHAQWMGRGSQLFGFPDEQTSADYLVGSLILETSPGETVGSVTFGNAADGSFAASLPLERVPATDCLFAHVASGQAGEGQGPYYFTGLGILNPNPGAADVTLQVYRSNGQLTGAADLQLAPGARISRLIDQFVPSARGQIGGFVRLRSNPGVVAFELFGDSGLNFLSAVPVQR